MAVYTQLTREEIEAFLTAYDVGPLTAFRGISEGVTNSNYLLEVQEEKYILTLFEKRYNLEELPYFTTLMEWWQARGIPCPRPLKQRDGRTLAVLKERPALMVTFLEGLSPHKIALEHIDSLGRMIAQMHLAGMGFPHRRANGLSLAGWEQIIDDIAEHADEIAPGLKQLISAEYTHLSEHWPSELPSGPVHADIFPDNIFFTRDRKVSGVIDCYFACHDFWAYDLAIAVNAWCFDERHRIVSERVQALMAAYNDVRPMTPEEDTAFPLLLRGAALRFLLTRAQDWLNPAEGADITPKDPLEYVAKLAFFQEHRMIG